MSTAMYRIIGGDYERAGAAAGSLKEMLKKVGVEPIALRRAMIAAYEAETNVAIHSVGGEMRVRLEDGVLEVEVEDGGPGIPDVELAMREGYSTAPAAARELGFGAGMGLPNIKKNSDRFEIESAAGKGTRVQFTIYFAAQAAAGRRGVSLRVAAELCTACLRCLRACPTEALRVRGRRPEVLEHLCIECGACVGACASGALALRGSEETLDTLRGVALIVPAALLVQFGPKTGPEGALAALAALGFEDVRVSERWEEALREAAARYARAEAKALPAIAPLCPAAVSLLEMRFPSLLGHLAPYESPVEAARGGVAGRDAAVVAVCPAQCSALAAASGPPVRTVSPHALVQAIMRKATEGGENPRFQIPDSRFGPAEGGVLRVTGLRQVMAALEGAENGLLADVPVLELWACEEGCFGSPMLREVPAVARWRWERRGAETPRPHPVSAVRRERAFAARKGLRLDDDMGRAIAKLAELDRLIRGLPGRDCALCGAPSCRALAEDIVLGRGAAMSDCQLANSEERTK